MSKNNTIDVQTMFFALLMLLVFVVGCANNTENSLNANKNSNGNNKNTEAASKTISTGSLDSGDASVDLTPTGMKNGKFEVDISINTHSVDLSQFDLMQITTLEYDGKIIKPLSAPELSGHHSSGTLSFDTGTEIKNFKIIIRGIPAVEERIFEWS